MRDKGRRNPGRSVDGTRFDTLQPGLAILGSGCEMDGKSNVTTRGRSCTFLLFLNASSL